MTRVTVNPAALELWSADATHARTRLTSALLEVDSVVAGLTAGWDGAAAQGFDRHFRRWRGAGGRLLDTLGELGVLADTASANYTAAALAGRRTWSGAAAATPASTPAGRPARRIDAEVDDIRATVHVLTGAAEDMVAAWQQLSGALAGTAGMAGDDAFATLFGRDHEGMAAAAWQAWRSAAIMLSALAGGLSETGNAILAAEHLSNPTTSGPPPTIDARPVPVPAPAPPPHATGPNGSRAPGPLAAHWPTADPEHLRAASAAWRAAAPAPGHAATGVAAGMDALVRANADPTLASAREFAVRALSTDASTGLCGVLGQHGRQIATACAELADVTERTRLAIRDAIGEFFAADEWYHPVAAVLDAVLTRGAAGLVARGGDLALLAAALDRIRAEHEQAVRPVLAMLSPAAADRLSRLATSLVPPVPVSAAGCAVEAPSGLPEAERRRLLTVVADAGHKIDPNEVLQIVRAPDGHVVWLERGNGRTGLSHLLRAERLAQFAGRGVAPEEVPTIAVRAITEGTRLGSVRDGGTAYEVPLGDRRVDVVVVEGSNGYLVTAYPLESRSRITITEPRPGG